MSTPALVPRIPAAGLPANLRAGDALAWEVQTQLLPGTVLFYVLTGLINNVPRRQRIGDPGVVIDPAGLASFTLASTVTSTWLPGRYDWQCFAVDSDGNRTQIAEGRIFVAADPAGTTPVDPRTSNEKLLANINAMLLGKSLDDAQIYKLGERELTKMTIRELQDWKDDTLRAIRDERRRRNGQPRRIPSVDVQFGGR